MTDTPDTAPRKFRKKPVVIEAMQLTLDHQNQIAIEMWLGEWFNTWLPSQGWPLEIRTLEGIMKASTGDWIIKGVNGEFYPCKPDIFDKTYEAVDD
jgi:hypothetical protein